MDMERIKQGIIKASCLLTVYTLSSKCQASDTLDGKNKERKMNRVYIVILSSVLLLSGCSRGLELSYDKATKPNELQSAK